MKSSMNKGLGGCRAADLALPYSGYPPLPAFAVAAVCQVLLPLARLSESRQLLCQFIQRIPRLGLAAPLGLAARRSTPELKLAFPNISPLILDSESNKKLDPN